MNVHQPVNTNELGPLPAGAAVGEAAPRKRRRLPWVMILILLAAAAGAYYAYSNGLIPGLAPPAATVAETPAAAPVAPAVPAAPRPTALSAVEVATVAPQTLADVIRVTGSLSPARQALISAQLGGTVTAVNGRPGETVSAGDVLVEIESADLASRLEERQSALVASERQLALATTTRDNARTLNQRNVTTQAALDQAEASFANAEAAVVANRSALRQSETALANATLRAPFDGVIAERTVDPGTTITMGTRLFTIVDVSDLTVEVAVPSTTIARVALGQTAALKVDGVDGKTFTATVDRISPVTLTGTRSIPVYLTLPNPDGMLRGGMFAAGAITLREKPGAVALAASSVRTDDSGTFVLVIQNGVLARNPVTVADFWNDGRIAEIAAGLAPGAQVVTGALPELSPGMAVVVEN